MTKTQQSPPMWPAVQLAAKQIKRLAQMKNYPRGEEEALKELAKAMQTAKSEEQAIAVISEVLATATPDTRCPMPHDIRAACKALQLDPQPDPNCQFCRDTPGWRIIIRAGLSGATRCTCWAPRPAPKIDYVPLTGQPGREPNFIIEAAKTMKPEDPDEKDRAEVVATHITYGKSGEGE